MSYASIDSVISTWAKNHKLHVYEQYKDEEVRSVEFVGTDGEKCQLWIDPPDPKGTVQVHLWDYKKRRQDCKVSINDLQACLDTARTTALSWLKTA
jgi:hypothetical protein